jgi:hypothetical protein
MLLYKGLRLDKPWSRLASARPLGPVGVAQPSARGGARSTAPDVRGTSSPAAKPSIVAMENRAMRRYTGRLPLAVSLVFVALRAWAGVDQSKQPMDDFSAADAASVWFATLCSGSV